MLGVERIGYGLETVEQCGHRFLGNHADGFPFFLDFLHGLELVLPEYFVVGNEFFGLLAEFFLGFQIFLAFGLLFFDERSAVLFDFVAESLELFAVFVELGRRDGANFTPLVAQVAELGEDCLARCFVAQRFHLGENFVAVFFVVPRFPLLHFLETCSSALVFLPQVVVLELLFADDGLPFLERLAELLVDFLEVLVLVDCLDSFDESRELHLVFGNHLFGVLVERGNLFAELVAQGVVALEDGVGAFEERELFPFAHDGVEILGCILARVRIGKSLEAFQQFWTGRFLVLGLFVIQLTFEYGTLQILCLEECLVEALDACGIHDGLFGVPFFDDGIDAFALFLGIVFVEQGFQFFKSFSEVLLLGLQFLFGLECSNLCFVCFVAELDETFVNLVECCLGWTHTQGLSFFHQGFELRTDRQRILLGGKVVSLLDKGFALAEQERCGLLTTVLGFLGRAELFGGHLADGGVLGVLGNILEGVLGLNALECGFGYAFLGVAVCGISEERLLGALLDQFESKFGRLHGLEQFFGVASVFQFIEMRNNIGSCGFAEFFQLLGDFFVVTRFSKTADHRFGIVFRNVQQRRDNGQFFDGCQSYVLVFIAQCDVFEDVLML